MGYLVQEQKNMKKKTKDFFKVRDELKQLSSKLLNERAYSKYGPEFSLYLTELYFRSQRVCGLIDQLRKNVNCKLTEKNVDELLALLVELKIEFHVEISDWIKALQKPIMSVIDEISEMLSRLESEKKQKKKKARVSNVKGKPKEPRGRCDRNGLTK